MVFLGLGSALAALIVGVILIIIARAVDIEPIINKILYVIGAILVVVGIIFLILGLLGIVI
jgi:hypothetical protein